MPGKEQGSQTDHMPVPVWVHLFLVGLLPVLLVFSHRNVVAVVALMAIASLFYSGAWSAIRSAFARPDFSRPGGRELFWLLSAFSFYALLSALWTPAPERWSWALQLQLFFLCGAGILWLALSICEAHAQRLARVFAFAVGLGAVLLGIEGATGGLLRDIVPPDARPDKDIIAAARGTAITMTLLPPVLLMVLSATLFRQLDDRVRWGVITLVLFALTVAALRLEISANVLALGAGIAAGLVALWRPFLVLAALFLAVAAAFLLAPFVALALPPVETLSQMEGPPVSWVQRLIIWRLSAEHIFAGPGHFFFGGGINYGWWISQAGESVALPGFDGPVFVMPTHPHSVFVQVWLEFGLVGTALCLAGLWLLWRLIRQAELSPRQLAALCAVIAMTFVFALVETSIWTPWRLVAPLLAIYGFILVRQSVSR